MSEFYTNVYQRGNFLYVRGVDNGYRYSKKIDFQPTVWASGQVRGSTDRWKTLDGSALYSIKPGSMNEYRNFVDMYKDIDGFNLHVSPGHVYQYIADTYTDEIMWDPADVVVSTIDIETETEYGFPDPKYANEVVQLITIKNVRQQQITTFGLYEYDNQRSDVKYIQCSSEGELLKQFVGWWQMQYPDAVTGWNTSLFDITYLYNRMCKVVGESYANKLSPYGQVLQREVDLGGRTAIKTTLTGISSLDYLDLYKKFTYSAQESYKLDYIASVELGERKLENPGATFKEFYQNHWQTFVSYNIKDVELVDKLDDKMRLIDLALTMAYDAKVNYEDVFSPVKTWDIIIYNYLNKLKIVVPQRKTSIKDGHYEGAYVKDPLVGKHYWGVSFDLNSLYPHLIMQYNMSPETIVDTKLDVSVDKLLNKQCDLSILAERDLTMAANGWCFRKDVKGLLPTQMQLYYDRRVQYKNAMLQAKQKYEDTHDNKYKKEISRLNNLQMAMKILLNSAYGAMGNSHFRYFDIRIAEGITVSGQLSIRWIANKLNGYVDKITGVSKDRVVLIDTDSVVLTLNDLVKQIYDGQPMPPAEKVIQVMDRIAEERIQPFIDRSYQELADYVNAYAQKMQMKRENLVDVMVAVSKKRYVMNVHNSEGVQYKEPQLKIMGLQMVKSSTPAVIRTKLRESLKTILTGSEKEIQKYCADFRVEFDKFTPEEIAFPRSINDVGKYRDGVTVYSKGTPIHVRGALLYNHHIDRLGLQTLYPSIREGDKIKFIYLQKPNLFHEDCIAFLDKLPPEFKIHKYVDYDKMFQKTFLDAVQNILDAIGWNTESRATLEDFF